MSAQDDAFAMAIEDTLGPALVVDAGLRVQAVSEAASALLGPHRVGDSLVQLLCGESEKRPVAEALARGEAVLADVPRPASSNEDRMLSVRTSPLVRDGVLRGHLVLLSELERTDAPNAVVTRWGMTTAAPVMKRLFRQIERIGRRQATVLGAW